MERWTIRLQISNEGGGSSRESCRGGGDEVENTEGGGMFSRG